MGYVDETKKKQRAVIALGALLPLLITGCKGPLTNDPTDAERTAAFKEFAKSYPQPELFQDNEAGLSMRLKALDLLPAGSHVKIATFTMSNGKSTRHLARHLCLAAKRGVRAELLVDSKTGDQPGRPSLFEDSDEVRIQSELLLYLANCGVDVYVHNHLESYIEVLGHRVPNIFLDPSLDGAKFGVSPQDLLKVTGRVNAILGRIDALVQSKLGEKKNGLDFAPFLENLKQFAVAYGHLYQASKKPDSIDVQGRNSAEVEKSIAKLGRAYRDLLHAPLWEKLSADEIKALIPQVVSAFASDSELMSLRREFRRANRLNHRKLFLVESSDSGVRCMLLGGRNIGDEYLESNDSNFNDGDVFLCGHHGAGAEDTLQLASNSFESLKSDESDPVLGLDRDNSVRKITAVPNYQYGLLLFESGELPEGASQGEYSGALTKEERTMPAEREIADPAPIHGDFVIDRALSWKFLKSDWSPAEDQVAARFSELIQSESQQVYIETPYADFSGRIREAIAAALERGVKVQIVTNSFATSDGGSKPIRLLMERWVAETKRKYPERFLFQVTTAHSGHMTHFKFAAFACSRSPGVNGAAYIIGSHNFHGRSGYSDKEHALYLLRDEKDRCLRGFESSGNLVSARAEFYRKLSSRGGGPALANHRNIVDELAESYQRPGPMRTRSQRQSRVLSEAIIRMLYDFPEGQKPALHEPERLEHVLRAVDDGGVHDLIGYLL